MQTRIRWIGVGSVAAAVLLLAVVGISWSLRSENATAAEITAAEILAKGAVATSNVSSVHIEGQLRTAPADNFSLIVPEADLVRIDVWKQFGEKSKWRVEKPGRVVVMDGDSTVMLIRPSGVAGKFPAAQEGFDAIWLLHLTSVGDLLNSELRTALAKGWNLTQTHETAADGESKLVVTVETKAGLPEDHYFKNKFIDTADTRRVYRFDAQTQRLEELKIYLHQKAGDQMIFTTTRIEYDQPIDPSVFSLELPKDVTWYREPEKLPDNEKYEQMTPKQAAQAFFEACSNEDWAEAEKFIQPLTARVKQGLGGLKILSLGEPFQAKPYGGWFVPYEIRLKSGRVHKHNLAVRNDNPAKRYVVDGGI